MGSGGQQTSVTGIELQLVEALSSSLDIRVVLERAYPLLVQLVPADYGALGTAPSAKAEDFEWSVAALPDTFFAAYPEMAAHDFVRAAVAARPNVVLRDQEMVPRAELERNLMYRRAREVGAPIEHVMAVMLHVDARFQSGLSLYRDRRRPFTASERHRLQRVTPILANAVRNCYAFGVASDFGGALERLLTTPDFAALLTTNDGAELARSSAASALLERWFPPHELRDARLPPALVAVLNSASANGGPASFCGQAPGKRLDVGFFPLRGRFGDRRWLVRLEEHGTDPTLPATWCARLTARQQQVAAAVLRGWDNRLIGAELGCSEATVKKHLQGIFDKLGVDSRTTLVVRASRNDAH
jgi:DNA-binding CsgD family transcriptional regulator